MVLNEVPGKVFQFQNLAIFKQVHQRIIAVEVQNIIYVVCGLNKLPGSETEIVSLEEISQAAFYPDQACWFIVPYFCSLSADIYPIRTDRLLRLANAPKMVYLWALVAL